MEGAPKDLALPLAEVGLALALAEAEDVLAAAPTSPPVAPEAGLAVAVTLNENGGGKPGGGKDARDDAPLAALPPEEGAEALAPTVLLGEDDDLRGAPLADVENRTRDVLVGLLPPPPDADADALPELPLAAPLPLPLATPDALLPPLLLLLEDALAAAPAAGKNISMTPITPSC